MLNASSILTAINPAALASAAAEASLRRDLDAALCNMLLPEALFKLIESPMSELGFPLKKGEVYDMRPKRVEHYCTQTDYGAIALLHLPDWVMGDDKNVGYVSSISDPFIGYGGLFVFSPVAFVPSAYDRMIEFWCEKKSFKNASCFVTKNLEDLESFEPDRRKVELRRLLKLKVPPSASATPLGLDAETKRNVFISYSHKDAAWLGKLKMFLQPLEKQGLLRIWDDTNIRPGSEWLEEIKLSLESARVAVLLITQNFLTSEFIDQKELPVLLKKAENRGCLIFWVAVSESTVDDSELSRFQAANDPKQPLDTLSEPEQNRVFKSIYDRMKEAVQ
jgi:TIR domain